MPLLMAAPVVCTNCKQMCSTETIWRINKVILKYSCRCKLNKRRIIVRPYGQ